MSHRSRGDAAPVATRRSRNSTAAAAAAAAVPLSGSPAPELLLHSDYDTDGEYYEPPPAPLQTLKRHSTPPHSVSEDVDHEEAIQVRPPAPKRQRTGPSSAVYHRLDTELDMDADDADADDADAEDGDGEDLEAEDDDSVTSSSEHPVGSDLAAFAQSLGRLSEILVGAGKELGSERIGALENEIHHDWRVDEMATFVEGFLKGASSHMAKGW